MSATVLSRARSAGSRLTLLAHAAIVAAAIWPFVWGQAAAGLVDLPNAIGRVGIGLRLLAMPGSSPFYDLSFKLIPNMAVDVWGLLVGRLVGAEMAVNLFVAMSICVFYGAVQALRRALFGRGSLVMGALTVFSIYGLAFRWGFINYVFASGLMIWAVARLEVRLSLGSRAFAAKQAVLLLTVFLCSVFPVMLYFVYAGARVVRPFLAAIRAKRWTDAARMVLEHGAALPLILAAVALGAASAPWGVKSEWLWSSKAEALQTMFWFQSGVLEQIIGCTVVALAVLLAGPAQATLRAGQAVALAALAATFFAVPFYLRGVAFADSRMPGTILGLVLGCIAFRPVSSTMLRAVASILVLACLMKPVDYFLQVLPLLRSAQALPALFKDVPEHSRLAILAGADGPSIGGQNAWHVPLIQLTRMDYGFPEIFPNYFVDLRAPVRIQADGGLDHPDTALDHTLACSGLTHVVIVGRQPVTASDLPAEVIAAAEGLTMLRIRPKAPQDPC